jgi:hypothetical protein
MFVAVVAAMTRVTASLKTVPIGGAIKVIVVVGSRVSLTAKLPAPPMYNCLIPVRSVESDGVIGIALLVGDTKRLL